MPISDWTTFTAYLDSSLSGITGVKEVIEGDLTNRTDYTTNHDMVGFYALLGEAPITTQISLTGGAITFERLRVRIGIMCNNTAPNAAKLSTAHYLLSDWRDGIWSSDQTFGGTCNWRLAASIVDKASGLPCVYFDIEIEW